MTQAEQLDWPRRVGYPTRQDPIRVRILDPSQKVGTEYRPEIPDSARQDMKRSTTNIYLSAW